MTIETNNFHNFVQYIRHVLDSKMTTDTPVFVMNIKKVVLNDAYLLGFPEEACPEFVCTCCLSFLEQYGSLATITETGEVVSLLWQLETETQTCPEEYQNAVRNLKKLVESAKIRSVFYIKGSDKLGNRQKMLGVETSGGFDHLSVPVNGYFRSSLRISTASADMRESIQTHDTLSRFINTTSELVIKQASQQFAFDSALRKFEFQSLVVQWLEVLKAKLKKARGNVRENLIWREVGTKSSAYIHIAMSVVGVYLDDCSRVGYSTAKKNFLERTKPTVYMRPTSVASDGTLEQASKIVDELGLAKSFERRLATFSDIPEEGFVWKPVVEVVQEKEDILLGLKKSANNVGDSGPIDGRSLIWRDFEKDILPRVTKLLFVPTGDYFVGAHSLTTAVYPEAPCIFSHGNHFVSFTLSYPVEHKTWGLLREEPVEVGGVITIPSCWGKDSTDSQRFLVLKDGYLRFETSGSIFPERTIPELYPVRKVVEQMSDGRRLGPSTPGESVVMMAVGKNCTTPLTLQAMVDGRQINYQITGY